MPSILLEPTLPTVLSSYSGALTSNSLLCSRPDDFLQRQFYCQPIQVTVFIAGNYEFRSNSTLDTRAYFYGTSFNPSNTTANLIAENDDGGGQLQFRIRVYLEFGQTYILVVTTHVVNATGSYSVSAGGPSLVRLVPLTITTPAPTTTSKFLTDNFHVIKIYAVVSMLIARFFYYLFDLL